MWPGDADKLPYNNYTFVVQPRVDWIKYFAFIMIDVVQVFSAYRIIDGFRTVEEIADSLESARPRDRHDWVVVEYKDLDRHGIKSDGCIKRGYVNRWFLGTGYSFSVSPCEELEIMSLDEYPGYKLRHKTLPDRLSWLAYMHYVGNL